MVTGCLWMAARLDCYHFSALLEFDPSLCEPTQYLLQLFLLLLVLFEVGMCPPSAVAVMMIVYRSCC